jgi:Fe-S-cluster containining protein
MESMGVSDIFSCKMCGDCCRGYGGTFVTRSDIMALSNYLGIDSKRVELDYCQMSGNKRILAQKKNGYCIFWDRLCTIHPVKPRMCKAWPFIESILVDVSNWHIMASVCPGMCKDVSDRVVVDTVTQEIKKGVRA